MVDLNLLRIIAVKAVEKACRASVEIQKQLVSADTVIKKDQSPVTVADYTVQAIVISELVDAFHKIDVKPFPIIAEEESNTLKDQPEVLSKVLHFFNKYSRKEYTGEQLITLMDMGSAYKSKTVSPKEKFWVIDPIDGTLGFLRNDQYAIALALISENHKPELGVLGCPSLPISAGSDTKGCLFHALKGSGAYMKILDQDTPDVKLSVSTQSDPSQAVFTESYVSRGFGHELNTKISTAMSVKKEPLKIDSQCKYAMVARGDSDVYLRLTDLQYRECTWDHASGEIIVEESGGVVTDFKGLPLDYSVGHKLTNNVGVFCSNKLLYPSVKSAIEKSIQF